MDFSRTAYVLLKRFHDAFYEYFSRFKAVRKLKQRFKESVESEIETIGEEPVSIFEKESWDNLIILDACRQDLYEEVKGEEVESRISLGSATMEYIERTFKGQEFEEIVYIAGNPYFYSSKLKELIGNENPFHEKYDTFMQDWNKEKGTVMPERITRDAESASKLFPEKKMIVHYMQPHYPFLKQELGGGVNLGMGTDAEGRSVWERAERGELERDEVWEAYRDNLEVVLKEAEELAEKLPGKTVITSDHGNLVGEANRYGHPLEKDFVPLRKVPWDVRKE